MLMGLFGSFKQLVDLEYSQLYSKWRLTYCMIQVPAPSLHNIDAMTIPTKFFL